jgi:hypothetical protein
VAEFFGFRSYVDIRFFSVFILYNIFVPVDGDDIDDEVLGFLHGTFRG